MVQRTTEVSELPETVCYQSRVRYRKRPDRNCEYCPGESGEFMG